MKDQSYHTGLWHASQVGDFYKEIICSILRIPSPCRGICLIIAATKGRNFKEPKVNIGRISLLKDNRGQVFGSYNINFLFG